MLDRALTMVARGGAQAVIISGIASYFNITPAPIFAGILGWILMNALLDVALEEPKGPPKKS